MTAPLILHSYDASPFTQKVLRMLGLKGLAWEWVETPMLPPKPELTELTGGYRGTPVLQIGADVFIDSQLIALELERRFPEPTLFPGGVTGLAYMLGKWSDVFFRAALGIAIEQHAANWDPAFRADRQFLFPDIDFTQAARESAHALAQFRAYAAWIDLQLADGRRYLSGPTPGLVDIHAHAIVWMARAYFPDVAAQLLTPFRFLPEWEQRVATWGEGCRRPMTAEQAFAAARRAACASVGQVDAGDPSHLCAGALVEIEPDDTRRGTVRGELLALDSHRVVVRRHGSRCGTVAIHFPRVGYRVSAATEGR
ncbi:MAG: glutathione S-transferase [Steroidobacteraceae bacterium]|nr:glutathione S-transferase [Steroidobacteraceae bacterium]MDW8259956.1 glutathione S-transferase [Gammaproteobacteria bacterium]